MESIRLVTLDLWGTILKDDKDAHEKREMDRINHLHGRIGQMGYIRSKEELRDSYEKMLEEANWRRTDGREVSSMEQLQMFLRLLNLPVQPKELYKHFTCTVLKQPPIKIEGVEETLRYLSGMHLWLISNIGRTDGETMRGALQKLGLLNYFSGFSFSDEVGWRKPRPEMFLPALKTAKVEAENALHIGDELVADYQGARDVGMNALLLDRRDRYRDTCISDYGDVVRSHEELITCLREKYGI